MDTNGSANRATSAVEPTVEARPARAADTAAAALVEIFDRHRTRFIEVTRRARDRFERRDWHGAQVDATERLALYKIHVDAGLEAVRRALGMRAGDEATWGRLKERYSELIHDRPDAELGQTFFNSVSRRVCQTAGIDARVGTLTTASGWPRLQDEAPVTRAWTTERIGAALIRDLLASYSWSVPYADLDTDAALVAEAIRAHITAAACGQRVVIEMVQAPFYRNKGAYLVGRIRTGRELIPLVLPLLNTERGIAVDAVLLTQDEASLIFGFSWSYFRVEAPSPRALVNFLSSIMPHKRIDELYTSIGNNKHGKTELYRSLMRHLESPEARFAFAEGDEGMVMSVFTLPAFNVVFKVIKDSFGAPKTITRQAVMEKYQFVFVRDRVGRLADAQEFEHLEFPRRCFPEDVLAYLLGVAGRTVRVEGDRVVVRHLYTERRVTPLNLFLRTASAEAAREAVVDYGNAIKDLAAADIFTGDMLLKNFGMTRHGRVICYDYDELCLLSECRFRRIPQPPTLEDELSAEPWFSVGEHDVFPEEFRAFLVPPGRLRDAFLEAHGDLLTVEYWQGVQERLAAGEVLDVFPYRRNARLRRPAVGEAAAERRG